MTHGTRVTNELLDLLANVKMPPTGLNSIHFSNWSDGVEESLNEAVIERLVSKTSNLQELTVSYMGFFGYGHYYSEEAICEIGLVSMADLVAQIITASTCLTKT